MSLCLLKRHYQVEVCTGNRRLQVISLTTDIFCKFVIGMYVQETTTERVKRSLPVWRTFNVEELPPPTVHVRVHYTLL